MLCSMLVVATSGAGYVLGSGSAVDLAGLCCTCAGTMMVAASANSLNQVSGSSSLLFFCCLVEKTEIYLLSFGIILFFLCQ